MEPFLFVPRDDDPVEKWYTDIGRMYLPEQPVMMHVDLDHLNCVDMKKVMALKLVLDFYRPKTRKYLKGTLIKMSNPTLRNIVRLCLVLFKPEKPVRFVKGF